jgi:hypothetical protein
MKDGLPVAESGSDESHKIKYLHSRPRGCSTTFHCVTAEPLTRIVPNSGQASERSKQSEIETRDGTDEDRDRAVRRERSMRLKSGVTLVESFF